MSAQQAKAHELISSVHAYALCMHAEEYRLQTHQCRRLSFATMPACLQAGYYPPPTLGSLRTPYEVSSYAGAPGGIGGTLSDACGGYATH